MSSQDPAAALSSLLRSASLDDHDEILKTANAALKANKTDETAQHTRVVALLKLDRFEDALRALADGGTKLESQCVLEKAYALYKTGALDNAAKLLGSTEQGSEKGFTHIAAQVAYRGEKFDEAHDLYERLLAEDLGNEETDLKINAGATRAQKLFQKNSSAVPVPLSRLPDTFELCYNEACARIAQADFHNATTLLQRALRLCDASDELSQEDKEAEMRPIVLQQAYVYAKLGKIKEANDLYQFIGPTSDSDPDFTVIAETNLSAMDTKPANPYLLQRKAETWISKSKKAKLFEYQSRLLTRNCLVLDLKAYKKDGVIARTEKQLLQAHHPTASRDINTLAVINAVGATHGATDKAVVAGLKDISAERPLDVGLALCIAQVYIQQNRPGAALSYLQSFIGHLDKTGQLEDLDVRYSPGLVALTVTLMRSQGRETAARSELVKAAKHWQSQPPGLAASLLQEAGIALSQSSNPADLALAGSVFQRLLEQDGGSHIASTGLVAALAPSDPEKIQKYTSNLPEADSLIEGIDVAGLIQAGVAVFSPITSSTRTPISGAKRFATNDKPPVAKRRKRTGKLPKNYEEGKAPDPERWLPLRDRSSYRPKGKKGKKKAVETTQGGIVRGEEETLELVGGGGVKVERAAGGGGAGGGASKKKKKGKK